MTLRSYEPQSRMSIEEVISGILRNRELRKLVLYPTELRDRSATYLLHLTTRLHWFYTSLTAKSPRFTKHIGENKGKR